MSISLKNNALLHHDVLVCDIKADVLVCDIKADVLVCDIKADVLVCDIKADVLVCDGHKCNCIVNLPEME